MIVKVTYIADDKEPWVMMFGNSYKKWQDQAEEYLRYIASVVKNPRPLKAEYSVMKWIGWGGLKWCAEEEFQNCLNREGCQGNEPDNPNPRQYSEMKFMVLQVEAVPVI